LSEICSKFSDFSVSFSLQDLKIEAEGIVCSDRAPEGCCEPCDRKVLFHGEMLLVVSLC